MDTGGLLSGYISDLSMSSDRPRLIHLDNFAYAHLFALLLSCKIKGTVH